MWAHAFRDSAYYAAVNTNNGTEALNKALKYSYLPKRKSLTLSGIATLLIDRFLPDMWQKYVFQNYKLSTEYRAYSSDIPTTYKVVQGPSFFIAYKGRQNVINSQRKISKKLMMTAFLKCTRQVEESTESTSSFQSVHARTGYAITYLANTSLPSSSSVQGGVGQSFHNNFWAAAISQLTQIQSLNT